MSARLHFSLSRVDKAERKTAWGFLGRRPTRPTNPCTNGQVERTHRTINEAKVTPYRCDSHDQLRAHLEDLLAAWGFAHGFTTPGGLTPDEYICKT